MKKIVRTIFRTSLIIAGIIFACRTSEAYVLWSDEHQMYMISFLIGLIIAFFPVYPAILMETAMWVARRAVHDCPISFYDRHLSFWTWATDKLAPFLLTKQEITAIKVAERDQQRLQQKAHDEGLI